MNVMNLTRGSINVAFSLRIRLLAVKLLCQARRLM
jgi:hypothetical protein